MTASFDKNRLLISGCVRGDQKACEELVRRFSRLVYRTVQQVLTVRQVRFFPEDLEDLHNTVFLKLFENRCKKLRQFQGKNGCSLPTWVRIVAARIVLNHLRDRGKDLIARERNRLSLEDIPELDARTPNAWDLFQYTERRLLLEKGIQTLSPRDRLFMRLHFGEGLSLKEVARAMSISSENVYTVKHRAIERLKSVLPETGKSENL